MREKSGTMSKARQLWRSLSVWNRQEHILESWFIWMLMYASMLDMLCCDAVITGLESGIDSTAMLLSLVFMPIFSAVGSLVFRLTFMQLQPLRRLNMATAVTIMIVNFIAVASVGASVPAASKFCISLCTILFVALIAGLVTFCAESKVR